MIDKDSTLYYSFYAPSWEGEPITLRGLDAAGSYLVTEYASDQPESYTVSGSHPVITPHFKDNYLIEVKLISHEN